MSNRRSDPASDLESLATQYWSAWAELARAPAGTGATMPGWKEGLAWWSQFAGQGGGDVNAAVERMNAQAGHWFGSMQQLAAGFAGGDAAPAEIARKWSEALGGAGGNPVADMFRRMSGADAHGFESWYAQIAPMLGSLRGEASSLLGLPTFGLAREHQERAQHLVQAQLAYQERANDYSGQLMRAGKLAFERFELKLAERSEPGRQIESARALFDLWIDAAEEAWGEVALSAEFRRVYGELVNAQMRLRAATQQQVEQTANLLGLPTRSELNASHRKVAALEREVRAMKRQMAAQSLRPESKPATPEKSPKPTEPVPQPRKAKTASEKAARTKPRAASSPRKLVLPQVAAPRAAGRSAVARKQTARKQPAAARKRR